MITKAINGDNEIEVYLIEKYDDNVDTAAVMAADLKAFELKKNNLQKTHRKPDPTGIHIDMDRMKLNTLWAELVENHVKVNSYNGMSRMTKLEGILELPCYNIIKDNIEWLAPRAIFRHFVTQPALSITVEGAGNIIMSLDTDIIVKTGKKTMVSKPASEASDGYGFRNPREPFAEEMKIVESHTINYSGYMYSIEMPKMNNFVCQGLLMSGVEYSKK